MGVARTLKTKPQVTGVQLDLTLSEADMLHTVLKSIKTNYGVWTHSGRYGRYAYLDNREEIASLAPFIGRFRMALEAVIPVSAPETTDK